ncbi:translesion DNA synthesis-associated protein ImuA [Xylophilus rhododendri]|uniref:Translesion DNA synthesis-associated protein ImuA n=1 Tax=Xylophilus rhododendri TaxID=2697032 RepID=A0A857J0D9_9BURK|nr:translesion DNA synthesis-associated protein ImuA [Xylophilus rhododendri]QHI96571.1 translesion DNA synthesis-associated protein ImuA [Xylophilus rhododendri]
MPSLAINSRDSGPSLLSQVWLAESLAAGEGAIAASGFAALDAELPGGGWPVGSMTEVLHAGTESFAWPLLLPALAQAVSARGRPVALIGAPHEPFGPALAAQGLPPEALLWVRCDAPAARLWACEQALRCAEVSAVLAWLPQARVGELRRLQLAAQQFDALFWVFRPQAQAAQASPARLRLLVEAAQDEEEGGHSLQVHLLKRRGPPLVRPVPLMARPARLNAVLAASQRRRAQRQPVEVSAGRPAAATVVRLASVARLPEIAHALDRPFLAA